MRHTAITCLTMAIGLPLLACRAAPTRAAEPVPAAEAVADDAGRQYFEKQVRPLFVERCLKCHSAQGEQIGGGLRLDHRAGWMQGGDLGPAIVPGDAEKSLLIAAVRRTSDAVQMPPDGRLSDREIGVLVRWIQMGAPDPRDEEPSDASTPAAADADGDLWAFQSPPAAPILLPRVSDRAWPESELDVFVLAELERRDLRPVPTADRQTLIRRATFDLTGLPPSPEAIEDFLSDDAPDAYARLLDRLLASPAYGERWGRFWLDVVRYADSNGMDENIAHGNAWRYRDYVVDAFNRDTPYDEFVREQLAGDLLPPSTDEREQRARAIATGFLVLGPKVLAEVDEAKMEMDIIDEQVETVGRAFMALTLGCARCHDHKFDPISTRDYYGLAGIFKSSKSMESFTKIARWHEVNIETDRERAIRLEYESRIAALEQQIDELERSQTASVTTSAGQRSGQENGSAGDPCRADQQVNGQARLVSLREQLKGLKQSCPDPATAMSVVDYDQPTDLRIHVRGSHLTQTDQVPRGIPAVFVTADGPGVELSEHQSGRLELANWLVDPRHPLVARVMVNRVWRWHFGRGLVESTDNFGRLGARPNHPALLDWLAHRFVADGWSLKSLHRQIMQSATYRLSSQFDPSNAQIDPDNHWQWRASVRRLEAEAIRDAVLAVSGQLDRSFGGSSLHVKNREFLFDHTSRDHTRYDSRRRSLYLPIIRNHLYDGFQLFDYTDASVMTSNRPSTVVAPQALFLMNGEMAVEGARALADRLLEDAQLSDQGRIARVFQLAYGRMPTEAECDTASRFLAEFKRQAEGEDVDSVARLAWTAFCQALLMSSEFIYLR